jgi:hypothetical protein
VTYETKQALLDNQYAQELALMTRQYQALFELIVDRVVLEHRAEREELQGVM